MLQDFQKFLFSGKLKFSLYFKIYYINIWKLETDDFYEKLKT